MSGVGLATIGAWFLATPDAAARDYGVLPQAGGDPYLAVKGVRDIGTGAMALTVLATGQDRALGWTTLAAAVIPVGDAVIVRHNNGSAATMYGMHGLTAASST